MSATTNLRIVDVHHRDEDGNRIGRERVPHLVKKYLKKILIVNLTVNLRLV